MCKKKKRLTCICLYVEHVRKWKSNLDNGPQVWEALEKCDFCWSRLGNQSLTLGWCTQRTVFLHWTYVAEELRSDFPLSCFLQFHDFSQNANNFLCYNFAWQVFSVRIFWLSFIVIFTTFYFIISTEPLLGE